MKNSLKYNSIVVLCGGKVGTVDEVNFKALGGCQSTQLTFTSSIVKEKSIGRKSSFYASEFRKDSVSFPLTWYPSDFENEERLGLNLITGDGKSISHKILQGFRTNILVLVDDESEIDLLKKDVSGVKAVFLPNSDMTSYRFSANVGEVTSADASFEADDAFLHVLEGYSGYYTGIQDAQKQAKPFSIVQTGKILDNFEQVFIPSGISVEIKDRYNNEIYDLFVSSVSFSVDFERNPIRGLGSKYDYYRNPKTPIFGRLELNILSPAFSGREYNINPMNESGFDVKILLKGTPMRDEIPEDYEFEFKKILISSDSTPFTIGGRSTNSIIFDIEDDGSDYSV